jgi:flagellar protein FlaG
MTSSVQGSIAGLATNQAPRSVPIVSESAGLSRGASSGTKMIEEKARDSVETAAKLIDGFVKETGRSLDFRFDESSGKQIVRVTNPSTGETVRQIPSEEAVQLARSLNYLQSVLVSAKA